MSILRTILATLLFSSFIYFEYFDISNKLINTIFALMAFYMILTANKKELFWSGFFIAITWFWWIGYSFIYYNLSYLIPFVLIGIGLVYGILFYFSTFKDNIYFRVSYIFLLSFVHPFGFNWFELKLPFINSYIGTSIFDFALVLVSLMLIITLEKKKKYFAIITLLFTINYPNTNISSLNFKIQMADINIPQELKWQKQYRSKIIDINLEAINKAIDEHVQLVILPETTLPIVLNKEPEVLQQLKEKSKYIDIVIGSLHYKDEQYHNSTYFFHSQNVCVAHKVVLIPFGEAVPLPAKIKEWINDTFYNGAKDYESAIYPTDFNINGTIFRNAICYEATTDKIFENLRGQYVIAISNNGWFVPSIEPTLQKLLLKYYAKKYGVKIFSVSNMSENNIIN